ncbi:unnamed protein product [Oreochromis niloticus]|nr:unnamed protein product [Mustela putorius furo]
MTLAEERELEIIREGLTYVTGDGHSGEPHWHAKYLWVENPASLPDNKRGVESTFLRTEKQLAKEPEWKAAYATQVAITGMGQCDVLNQIRAVLLRFRGGVYGALGDIKKMYNSLWLEDREMHLHRFLWRDSENDKLEEYAITRVNIGDKPAGCIAQLAMRETASLSTFSHLKEERQVLQQESYVDDILTSHNDMNQLEVITENTGRILKAGGFELKPWVLSGQSGRRKHDDKAINFSKRKKKMRVGQDLVHEQIKTHMPNPLTRRELLSQVSGLYDPVGLVTPAKQKGAILVRRAFQETKVESCLVKDTWDMALSDALREDAIRLFEEYAQLSKVTFARALNPPCFTEEPWAITFSDGSEQAYGAVLYLRWNSDQGTTIRLVESKAKLTPLDHKGDVVKAELCGAVFGSRLKKYFEAQSRIQVERWYHFVDSQMVIGAIQRESYGYQTFFANRIGEIQSSTRIQDWWWIPGAQNIADVVTRGASPRDLDEDSKWQNGPRFLSLPVSEWPVRSAKELAATAKENVNKLQRKAFVAALTRAKIRGQEEKQSWAEAQGEQRRPPAGDPKWEAVPLAGVISVKEREDALRDIFLAAQNSAVFPSTATDRLVVYKDPGSGLFVCGGRVQAFKKDQISVPILAYDAWVSTLLAREAHNESHEGVVGTLLRMRTKAWVIRERRIAQKVVDGCVVCRKAKAQSCRQIMGDLPPERTQPALPFEFTTVDLFGPYQVKDDVKKRVMIKFWGVVFCCMASRAIHTELVNSLSTEGFLMAYQRFKAIRGHPRKIWSDPGTNFIGAKSVLKELYGFLESQNKFVLEETAAKNGTEWMWKVNPADSPHRNGAAEAAVCIVKRALQSLGRESGLSYSEFQTALHVAANLANERPIDARVQSREGCIHYVTPNTLLLGRASQNGDFKMFDFSVYPYKRLQAIQAGVSKFWRSWSQLAGPNLFVRSKWHTAHRNVAVGDVVWLSDQNALRGHFKMGIVVSTNPDKKGIVRDVNVRVCSSYSGSVAKSLRAEDLSSGSKGATPVAQATILHRDVRCLVVLLPVEEQNGTKSSASCFNGMS